MFGKEILQEIDQTLDQLIENASAVSSTTLERLDQIEREAFEKTQESLLAHLVHMDEKLANKRQNLKKMHKYSSQLEIQRKVSQLERLGVDKTFSFAQRAKAPKLRKSRFGKKSKPN